MKVNVVVMNHVSFGVNCLVVVEIEKILFVGLCFLLFGGMERCWNWDNWCVTVLGISSNYDLSLFDLVLVETNLIDRC